MRGKKFVSAGVEEMERAGGGRPGDGDDASDGDGASAGAAVADPAEHLARDLARVRAKFGLDPLLASRSLAGAWKSERQLEEDEAAFVDAVADCLVAGLSLDDALNCWDTGDLAYQASDEGSGGDGDPEREDETVPIPLPPPRRASTAHRVLVR